MNTRQDSFFMARAIQLAEKGRFTTDPNPRVGCVLVKHNEVIAEGWHVRSGDAHAEVDALTKTHDARGATAYVTLEPCSHHGRTGPCSDALIKAGLQRVVIAMQDPNPLVAGSGINKMRDAGLKVDCGLLQEDAEKLNRGFLKRMRTGFPYIQSKLAMSLDGRTAMASGESKWITSRQSRQDVHRLRAESSAVLTGINTVLVDDPQLNARVDFDIEQPVRVILDSNLRTPMTAKIMDDPNKLWLLTCSEDLPKIQQYQQAGVNVFRVPAQQGRLDLHRVFELLAEQQINNVWVEAGATLNGALLDMNLVDEWLVYLAPCVLGDQSRGLFHTPELKQMADKKNFKIQSVRQLGPDLRMTLTEQR